MKKLAKTVFITGSSGFIGSNLAKRILTTEPDTKVVGLDNMNDYYDVRIKEARLVAYTALQNQLDRRNWAAVPFELSNGTARIEQSHRSG